MEHVNPYYLEVPLRPITGLGDGDEFPEACIDIDSSDVRDMKHVIAVLIQPYVSRLPPLQGAKTKLAYKYYLSLDNSPVDFERVFNALLPPFDPPEDARDFFVWVWEVCWPDEDYHLGAIEAYQEVADANEPLRDAPSF